MRSSSGVTEKCFVVSGTAMIVISFSLPSLTVLKATGSWEESSGVARTSPLLGHSMSTLRLYELLRKVQKLIGESGGVLLPKI